MQKVNTPDKSFIMEHVLVVNISREDKNMKLKNQQKRTKIYYTT